MNVELFIPCYINEFYPETAFNTIKLLESLGCKVSYNKKQSCCALPAYNSGFDKDAEVIALKFLSDFKELDYVVAPSSACIGMIKKSYPFLLKGNKKYVGQYKTTAFEISEFIINKLNVRYIKNCKFTAKAVYHNACTSSSLDALHLLRHVEGLELIDFASQNICCGFGGTFAIKHKEISSEMTKVKVDEALKLGAEYIISTDSSCLISMQGYISKNKLPIKTIHLVDVLTSGW